MIILTKGRSSPPTKPINRQDNQIWLLLGIGCGIGAILSLAGVKEIPSWIFVALIFLPPLGHFLLAVWFEYHPQARSRMFNGAAAHPVSHFACRQCGTVKRAPAGIVPGAPVPTCCGEEMKLQAFESYR